MDNEYKRVQDRDFLIGETREAKLHLQEVDARLYELSLQRLGWTDCINGLEELLRRCQTEDAKEANEAKKAKESKQKELVKQKDKK